MAYDSFEKYVQDNLYDQMYEAIEYFVAHNGYIGNEYIYSSNTFHYIVAAPNHYNQDMLDLQIKHLNVKSIHCKRIYENDCRKINNAIGVGRLSSCKETYHRFCVKNDNVFFNQLKEDICINDLISLSINLSADIVYSQQHPNNKRHKVSRNHRLFTVSFLAELLDYLNIVGVLKISELYESDFDPVCVTDTYLLPKITPSDLEDVAKDLFKEYYSGLYENGFHFPFEKILKEQGIKLLKADFKDNGIFGRIYFKKAFADDIMKIKGLPDLTVSVQLDKGTMLVSKNHYFMKDYGSLYNTIAHELVHWLLHKDFFKILCLLSDDHVQLPCSIMPQTPNDTMTGIEKAICWAEWQANSLATRIMMPKEFFVNALSIQCYLAKKHQADNDIENILELGLCKTAKAFGVSKFDAKARAIQLGIVEAEGTMLYHNDEHLPSISFKRNSLKKNQTYIIHEHELMSILKNDYRLAYMLAQQRYIFIGNVIVRNEPLYIKSHSHKKYFTLTKYAREHAEECCLTFERHYESSDDFDYEYYGQCYLSKGLTADILTPYKVYYANYGEKKIKPKKYSEIIKALKQEGDDVMDLYRSLPNSYGGTLHTHLQKGLFMRLTDKNGVKRVKLRKDSPEVTVEELSDETNISTKTINEMLNNENYHGDLETICAVCIGLHLPPKLSRDLLKKAKVDFLDNTEGYMQSRILEKYYTYSIEEVNRILKNCKLDTWPSQKNMKKKKGT